MNKYRKKSSISSDEVRRYLESQIDTIWYKLALIQNSAYIKALKLSKYHIIVAI